MLNITCMVSKHIITLDTRILCFIQNIDKRSGYALGENDSNIVWKGIDWQLNHLMAIDPSLRMNWSTSPQFEESK